MDKKSKKVTVSLVIDREIKDAIDEKARRDGSYFSIVVRKLIYNYFLDSKNG
jgi:hypothetical protein